MNKEIKHPCYIVKKRHEQHQFDLLYIPHNVFEGNTSKYISKETDIASRHKAVRALRSKETVKVSFVLKAICRKDGVFK